MAKCRWRSRRGEGTVGMKLWGAVWGALIGWMVVPDFPPAGVVVGALAGLVAGVWLGSEVKNRATAMVREAVSELNENNNGLALPSSFVLETARC